MKKWLLGSLIFMMASIVQAGGIERLHQFLNTTKTATGSFNQKVMLEGKELIDQAGAGEFSFRRPGCFQWHYQRPDEELMISNGKTLWFYDTTLEQVTVKKLTQALPATPASILFGHQNIERDFTLKALPEHDHLQWVSAVPKQVDSPFRRILIGLDHKGPVQMIIEDHFNQKTKLTFSHLQLNVRLKSEDFEFKIPPQVQVIKDPGSL